MDITTPDFLPTLSAGMHPTPAQGACFMEYASFLAGERWSDRPSCTDPVLAELARGVNDSVTDDARQRLLGEVHRVIGLRADEGLSLRIGLRIATIALPLVDVERQRSLGVGMRGMLLALAERGDTSSETVVSAEAALRSTPAAAARAAEYYAKVGPRPMHLIEIGGTQAIRNAVEGILLASGRGEADARLAGLLRAGIDEAESALREPAEITTMRLRERELLAV